MKIRSVGLTQIELEPGFIVVTVSGDKEQRFELEGGKVEVSPALFEIVKIKKGGLLFLKPTSILVKYDEGFGVTRVYPVDSKSTSEIMAKIQTLPEITGFYKKLLSAIDYIDEGSEIAKIFMLAERIKWPIVGLEFLTVVKKAFPDFWKKVSATIDPEKIAEMNAALEKLKK